MTEKTQPYTVTAGNLVADDYGYWQAGETVQFTAAQAKALLAAGLIE